MREALTRLEYSWTRPRRRLPKPTGHHERLGALDDRIETTKEDTTVLYVDETEVKRFPPLRRMGQPVGEQRAVRVPDRNGAFTLYGAIDKDTGTTYTRAFEKGRSDYTIQFLEGIAEQTTRRVLLNWDRATWHTSKAVRRYVGGIDRLETALLPPRTPEANPVEDLWRELKNQVAACLERSLGALVARCREYVRSLTPEQALNTAGIH